MDYFIRKFEAIPEERWTILEYVDRSGRCCALGHCGVRENASGIGFASRESDARESDALTALLPKIAQINDDIDGRLGGTPKQRILDALRRVKAMEVAK